MAWNGSSDTGGSKAKPSTKTKARKPSPLRGIVAGALVVALAVGAYFAFFSGDKPKVEKPAAPKGAPAKIAEVKPAVVLPKAQESVSEETFVDTNDPHRVVEVLSVTTNKSFGLVSTRVRRADGKVGKVITPANRPIFRHGTDQLLQMMLCSNSRVGVPPLPMRSGGFHDKEFLASLKDEIVINDDDSEKVRIQKDTVIKARAEIKELMDQGLHFDDILEDYRRLTSENRAIRNAAMRELNELHASGDLQGEREYQIRIDAALQQMGIDPLDKPMTIEERRAAHAERRAQRELEKQRGTEQ